MSGDKSAVVVQKPAFRGVLHQFAAAGAAAAGLVLVAVAEPGRATIGAAIFAASLVTLFAVSATYHRVHWSAGGRAWMRRADHAAIFILIAGTYTPCALVGLPPESSNTLLLAVWGGAALGVLQSLFWVHAPKAVGAVLALAVGWMIAPNIGMMRSAYGGEVLGLLLAGGILYSIGAVVYAAKRPKLWPTHFGYHEVFHALTVIAAALHFKAVLDIVRMTGT